jgi:hypothetical protein
MRECADVDLRAALRAAAAHYGWTRQLCDAVCAHYDARDARVCADDNDDDDAYAAMNDENHAPNTCTPAAPATCARDDEPLSAAVRSAARDDERSSLNADRQSALSSSSCDDAEFVTPAGTPVHASDASARDEPSAGETCEAVPHTAQALEDSGSSIEVRRRRPAQPRSAAAGRRRVVVVSSSSSSSSSSEADEPTAAPASAARAAQPPSPAASPVAQSATPGRRRLVRRAPAAGAPAATTTTTTATPVRSRGLVEAPRSGHKQRLDELTTQLADSECEEDSAEDTAGSGDGDGASGSDGERGDTCSSGDDRNAANDDDDDDEEQDSFVVDDDVVEYAIGASDEDSAAATDSAASESPRVRRPRKPKHHRRREVLVSSSDDDDDDDDDADDAGRGENRSPSRGARDDVVDLTDAIDRLDLSTPVRPTREQGDTPEWVRTHPTPAQTAAAQSRRVVPAGALTPAQFSRRRDALTRGMYAELNAQVFEGKLPSDMRVEWSKRLNRTAGVTYTSFAPGTVEPTARIELASKVVDSEERLRQTLCHEMCHAAAWLVHRVRKPPHGKHFQYWYASASARKRE